MLGPAGVDRLRLAALLSPLLLASGCMLKTHFADMGRAARRDLGS